MAINYPNGRPYQGKKSRPNRQSKKLNHGKRGMGFEDDINASNENYRAQKKAVIHKKPTPIQVVAVDYPKRAAAKITEAYYRRASTTDYNGIYRGFYLDFEAKETKNKTSFPLSNFFDHQIQHLEDCRQQGGICFVLVSFANLGRVFLLPSDRLKYYWDRQFAKKNSRKSIKLEEFEQDAIEISYGLHPRIPYLDAVDQLIEQREDKQ